MKLHLRALLYIATVLWLTSNCCHDCCMHALNSKNQLACADTRIFVYMCAYECLHEFSYLEIYYNSTPSVKAYGGNGCLLYARRNEACSSDLLQQYY